MLLPFRLSSSPRPPQHLLDIHELAGKPVAQVDQCLIRNQPLLVQRAERRHNCLRRLRQLEVVLLRQLRDLDR